MFVREKKVAPAHKIGSAGATQKVPATPFTFPAPLGGWVLDDNLASPAPETARVLDNWIPTTTGIKCRGGSALFATVGAAVGQLFVYRSGDVEQLFATTGDSLFELTTPADPEVAPTALITGRTTSYCATAHFGTSGGDFFGLVNGADDGLLYDGSTWSTWSAITDVATSSLSYLWSYANRLFFVEKDTQTFWYLPAGSIGGAAQSFSLAGVFRRGGTLLFGATWSSDSGAGLDDRCVFVSTEGEVAVYQGVDPSSSWTLVGVYNIPRPLGPHAHVNAGGDLLVATDTGIIPITTAVQNDIAALSGRAVSKPIAPYWQSQAAFLTNENWEMVKVTADNLLLVSQPADPEETLLVANLQTGAWARWTGIQNECLTIFNDTPYVGRSDGTVRILNNGGSDAGMPYTCWALGQFDPMGGKGQTKTILQARPIFQSGTPFTSKLTFLADFNESPPSVPESVADFTTTAWDQAVWDQAVWDAEQTVESSASWRGIGVTGTFLAPSIQITFGVTPTPVVELVSIDAMMHIGASVT